MKGSQESCRQNLKNTPAFFGRNAEHGQNMSRAELKSRAEPKSRAADAIRRFSYHVPRGTADAVPRSLMHVPHTTVPGIQQNYEPAENSRYIYAVLQLLEGLRRLEQRLRVLLEVLEDLSATYRAR